MIFPVPVRLNRLEAPLWFFLFITLTSITMGVPAAISWEYSKKCKRRLDRLSYRLDIIILAVIYRVSVGFPKGETETHPLMLRKDWGRPQT